MHIRKTFTRKNGTNTTINVENHKKNNLNLRKTIRNNITMRKYNLYNTVNANIRKALKEKIQNNELNNERMLSYVYATFEGHDTFNKDIKDIQHSGVKNS
jgi:hypothetical protein